MLLQLAVNNLLDNAIKYSGKEDVVLLKVLQRKRCGKLQVIDEGTGDITELRKEKFLTNIIADESRQTKGTGLGLYLTKKIVEQHNGSIM